MGDEDRGRAQPFLEAGDLRTHLHPQLGIQVRQRLVHQKRLGTAHDRAPHRHPLPLPTRQLVGLTVQKVNQIKRFRGLLHLLADLLARQFRQRQREGDVLAHRQMRVQGVRLEHHRDVTVLRRKVVDPAAVDQQVSGGDLVEAGDHVQRRRLPAPRRPHQDDELAVGNGDRQVPDRRHAVGMSLGHPIENDLSHRGHTVERAALVAQHLRSATPVRRTSERAGTAEHQRRAVRRPALPRWIQRVKRASRSRPRSALCGSQSTS